MAERLHDLLNQVASLLPYDEPTIQRLDKLSVLRLAVSFLQIKAHFQVCTQLASLQPNGRCSDHPFANLRNPMGPLPSLVDPLSRLPSIDCTEPFFAGLAQKAMAAFLLILNLDGDIFYVTESVESFIGYQQSDILHTPIFDMIHSEDREELRNMLRRIHNQLAEEEQRNGGGEMGEQRCRVPPMVLRFRCLLENTCGFVAEMRGRILNIHSHQSAGLSTFVPPPQPPPTVGRPAANQQSTDPSNGPCKWALVAICIPFVPPLQMDARLDDPVLKSKHSIDLGIQSMDMRLRQLLELDEFGECPTTASSSGRAAPLSHSLYSIIHPNDAKFLVESHEFLLKNAQNNQNSSLMIYRLISTRSQHIYYLQSSFRLYLKNGKPDTIGANHRILTEVDGESLLEKRNAISFKFLGFDDTLLQSPRIFQQPSCSTQQHSPMVAAVPQANSKPNPTLPSKDGHKKGEGNLKMTANLGMGNSKKGPKKGMAAQIKLLKEEKKEIKDEKKPSPMQPSAAMVGPYRADEAIPFGIQINCNSHGNGDQGPPQILHQPNNAAALFAAAQLQTNFLPSPSHLDHISLLPSAPAPIPEALQLVPAPFQMGHPNATASMLPAAEQQNGASICGAGNFGWTQAANGHSNGPPSAGLPGGGTTTTRLKRTQVTFERYYAETVDLSPYYQQYSSSFSAAGYPQPTGCPSSAALMDLTTTMGGANANHQWAGGQQQFPTDYWTSMMAAAAAAGIDPGSASAYSTAAQHFHFPPTATGAGPADLMGGLASSMLYWPTHGVGIDLTGMGNPNASLPPFYPAPPSSCSTNGGGIFHPQIGQNSLTNIAEQQQNHQQQQFPAAGGIASSEYVDHQNAQNSSIISSAPSTSIPKTSTNTLALTFGADSAPQIEQQTMESGQTKAGKLAATNDQQMEEERRSVAECDLREKLKQDLNNQKRTVPGHLTEIFAPPISTGDPPTQLLHFPRHHHPHSQSAPNHHLPMAISANIQTPTPSSASSSTSGFRFLSEVAQTLFG